MNDSSYEISKKKFSNDNSGEIQDEPWYIDR